MRAPLSVVLTTLLFVSSLALLQSCGAPATTRQLLSVTISPSSATAPGSNQVQFVATGHYNTEPLTVTPLGATWGATKFPQQVASTTQDGLATCVAGASGTTTIEAWVQVTPSVCNLIDSAGRPGCGNVWAAAQLTCP